MIPFTKPSFQCRYNSDPHSPHKSRTTYDPYYRCGSKIVLTKCFLLASQFFSYPHVDRRIRGIRYHMQFLHHLSYIVFHSVYPAIIHLITMISITYSIPPPPCKYFAGTLIWYAVSKYNYNIYIYTYSIKYLNITIYIHISTLGLIQCRNMYVCMYVCMHVCIYVSMYLCTYVCNVMWCDVMS